jgi:ATP-binding cassette subfamily C protein LapB
LLQALIYFTAYFGHARSADALTAGLPVENGELTPALFCQAAERAGLRAKVVKRALEQVPPEVLPAVAVLKKKRAAVLLKVEGKGKARIVDAATRAESVIALSELARDFTGYVIYVRPGEAAAEGEEPPLAAHWFWQVMLENRGIYARVLVASFLVNCFALTSPIFIMNFYNRVLPDNAIDTGWVLSIGAASVFVFDFLIRTLRAYFIDVAGRRADVIAAQRLYNQVLDMRLGFRPNSVGVFANSLQQFDMLREFFNSATMTGLVDFPFSLLFIAVIWVVAGSGIAALLGILYALAALAGWLLQLPVRRKVHLAMKSAEQRHGLLVETISSIETIRGVGGEGPLRAAYARYVARAAEAGQDSRYYSGLSVHFSIFVQQVSAVLIVLLGMYLVADKALSMGALIAAVLLSSRALAPVAQVASLVNKYHAAKSAYRDLDGFMRQPVERPRDKKFLHRPVLHGNVALRDVGFSYPRTQRPVLSGVTLSIREGDKIAVVGRIGSGKSTLVKLLLGFYEPGEGTILLDDTDLRQIDPADLRRNVAYMGQDTALLSGTIRENLVMGRPQATDAEVLAAAEMTGVHDFVRRHPLGYDAPVGERGEGLSGGQRQALALARTLLPGAPMLVLDEPTNAMDAGSEERVLKGLEDYARDKTLIIVTHKPALLRLVNRVIVMEGGRVAADGMRDQVIAALAAGKLIAPREP